MKKVISELFLDTATKFKDRIAFNFFNGTWKTIAYGEFLHKVRGIASHLLNGGIKRGDRIAVISENRPEWCMAYLGISLTGGVVVPIDAQLGPEETANLLADSASRIVFHSSKTERNLENATGPSVSGRQFPAEMISFDSTRFGEVCGTGEEKIYPEVGEEDLASIIYTSGTTGRPKGVMLTHGNFCSDAEALMNAGILAPGDSVVSILPLHHTYPFMGNFLVPVFLGIPITYPRSLKGPELMESIRDKEVTIVVAVPQLLELIRNGVLNKIGRLPSPLPGIMTALLKLCRISRRDLNINLGKIAFRPAHAALGRQFRFFACGGAKLDPQLMQDLEAIGFTVLEGYGLTETSPVVTFNPIERRKPGSAGRPLPSVELRIIDPGRDRELDAGEEGEIVIRGPMVMKGYYRNPEATAQALREGWFFSGDLGYLDDEGYLFITGRVKEVIVLSSGKNVYPDEVERRYSEIPLIKEICVTGGRGKGSIESLQAVIVPDFEYARNNRIGNLQETLKQEVNNISLRLPQYMRLRGYRIHSGPLPRTPLGKLRRFMVDDLLTATGREHEPRQEDRQLMEDETGRKVVGCITPLLKEHAGVRSSDSLELDLGFDSLAKIELVVALEQAFSVRLPETFLSEIQTVGELVTAIKGYGTGESGKISGPPAWKDILQSEPGPEDREKAGFRHSPLDWLIIRIGLGLVKAMTRYLFRLRVEGIEHMPGNGPFIITPNHASYLDGFVLISSLPIDSFKNLFTMGLEKFFAGRLGGAFARLAHIIPIDPETSTDKSLRMASFVLRSGKSLLIFPEGGRSYDGELMEFKKGVGILSLELDAPVIPAYIVGSFDALPRGARWPRPVPITITFGEPLYPSGLDFSNKPHEVDRYQFLVNQLREKVQALKEAQERGGV